MKRTGFTLIELLAVIVILAIIALIATPIVLDIIKDSKESSKERSQELFIDGLTQEIARRQLNSGTLSDGVYSIKELDVPIKGEKPESGYVYIKNGNIVKYNLQYEDNKKITNSYKIELEKDILSNTDPFSISAVTLSFDDTIEFNFYIKKEEMDKYKDVYILIENTERFDSNNPTKEILKEFKELDEYYIFTYNNTCFEEFTNVQTITLVGTNNDGEKKTQIKYNVADYIKNIISKNETSQKTKKLLIALAKLASSTQTYFKYRVNNLVTSYLEIDANSILSTEAEQFINSIDELQVSGENSSIYNINMSIASLKNKIDIGFVINKTNLTEQQLNSFGVLLFSKDSYDRMMKNGIDYNLMTVDSKYLLADLKYDRDSEFFGKNSKLFYLLYSLNFNNINEQIYYRTYSKVGDNYTFGDIRVMSFLSVMKELYGSKDDKSIYINTANFIALLNEYQ